MHAFLAHPFIVNPFYDQHISPEETKSNLRPWVQENETLQLEAAAVCS